MSGAMQWFRLYHRMVDDDKLRLLAFEDRWHFVALCCLKASGLLDTPDSALRQRQIAVKLGVQVRELEEIGRRLFEVNLIDETLNPLAWDELQYRSDNSSERVKKFREKQRCNSVKRFGNVSETVQETDTDTDTDTEITASKDTVMRAAKFPKLDCSSDEVWKDFLANRKAKRLQCTPTAHKRLVADLNEMAARTGWPPGEVFEACVAKGWGAIYDPRDAKVTTNGKQQVYGRGAEGVDRRSSLARAIDEGLAALGP